ncbi:hypothetical protein D3C87_128260 [compost metagenome]
MRKFSLIMSLAAFATALFYLILDFPSLDNFGGIVYFLLMIVLLLICVTGIIINMPLLPSLKIKRKIKNSY